MRILVICAPCRYLMKPGVLRIKRAISFHPFVRTTLDNVTPVDLTVKVCSIVQYEQWIRLQGSVLYKLELELYLHNILILVCGCVN